MRLPAAREGHSYRAAVAAAQRACEGEWLRAARRGATRLSLAVGGLLGQWHVVADSRLRKQISRVSTIWFDFAADALSKCPHVVGFLAVLSAPDRLQDLPVQQNLACVACKIRQHFKFAPRQRHVDAVYSCATIG